MTDAMFHRGADDLGFYLSPDCRVGLTTRRLSIRDDLERLPTLRMFDVVDFSAADPAFTELALDTIERI